VDFKTFEKEMQRCELLIRTDSKRESYWRGYQRGLRRTYYKEEFGTHEEHLKILKALYSEDEKQKLIVQGYDDALQDWGKGTTGE
jgi:hypothetical protein